MNNTTVDTMAHESTVTDTGTDGMNPENPVADVARFMHGGKLCLTTAESCTAGLIAATLADIPGAGALLDCAYVVYSTSSKQHCVGVRAQTLQRFNLTSEEIAREMALGALKNSCANVAVANTGVTDDTDPAIPAGTQCFAWAFLDSRSGSPKVYSETQRFDGDRHRIRESAALYALSRIPHYAGQNG